MKNKTIQPYKIFTMPVVIKTQSDAKCSLSHKKYELSTTTAESAATHDAMYVCATPPSYCVFPQRSSWPLFSNLDPSNSFWRCLT